MKKIISFLFLSVIYFGATAQSPDSLSFQAVIRDADGTLLADQSVSARIGIYQGAENGTKVFEETHTATTNENGLLTLLIGGGTNVTGDLSTMDWGKGPYFIKREIDPNGGTDYVISGTSQFLSVPYALYAASGGSADNMGNHTASQDLDMNGNAITDTSDDTLTIEVKLNDQDIQIVSYDEIHITTIEGSGNDPDGNTYNTSGNIELTSDDDILVRAKNGLGVDAKAVFTNTATATTIAGKSFDVVVDNGIRQSSLLLEDTRINLDAHENINLVASDSITITASSVNIHSQGISLVADAHTSGGSSNATARIYVASSGQLNLKSGSGENLAIETGNDIKLIANDGDLDFVEIWSGNSHSLYNLPNREGEEGQILIREGTATGATSERFTQWTPYKLPLADGSAGQVLQTDGSGTVTWVTPSTPVAKLSGDAPQTFSNYEDLNSKTKELSSLLNVKFVENRGIRKKD